MSVLFSSITSRTKKESGSTFSNLELFLRGINVCEQQLYTSDDLMHFNNIY